ncbi:MAG TPA: tRNA pseudouridine(13) synthase TruD [Thermofilum sp.]|nr:tRNA pseudouridine(13) synthase TruD [Thermofilum sp.]
MVRETYSKLDRLLGLEVYASNTKGIGGRIKLRLEDFIVKEVTLDNVVCDPQANFEDGNGEYTWFVLEKKGLDTITALRVIARGLRISSKRLSAAGLKDSKAITYQLACVKGLNPETIEGFIGASGKVKVHKAFRRPFKLKPGMLYGNEFEIRISDIPLSPDDIKTFTDKVLEELREIGGVPNFYGYQRFGTIRPNTHMIGLRIIRGEFKEAIEELLFHIYPAEPERSKKARVMLRDDGDFERAIEYFPLRLHQERTIIRYLAKHPGDYIGALRALPIEVRRLFIGAYQAFLFNKMLSCRLRKGLPISNALPGDIVVVFRERNRIGGVMRVNEANVEKINELIARGAVSLVLNVYGYDTIPARGPQGEIEREVLKEQGISIESFKLRHMPEIATRGTLRVASFMPEDLDYKVKDRELFLKFRLKKGMYATVFLREIMKPEDPLKAGF